MFLKLSFTCVCIEINYIALHVYRFAFVEFDSVEKAVEAQKEKDGLEINGREVQLAFATDKQSGGGGGGGGFGGRRGGGGM